MMEPAKIIILLLIVSSEAVQNYGKLYFIRNSRYALDTSNGTESSCTLTISTNQKLFATIPITSRKLQQLEYFVVSVLANDTVMLSLALAGCVTKSSVQWIQPEGFPPGNISSMVSGEKNTLYSSNSMFCYASENSQEVHAVIKFSHQFCDISFLLNILIPPSLPLNLENDPLLVLSGSADDNTSIWNKGNIFKNMYNELKMLNLSGIQNITKWRIAANYTGAFILAPILELLHFSQPWSRTVGYFTNDDIQISFYFMANPRPSIDWFIDSTSLKQIMNQEKKYTVENLNELGAGLYRATLLVKNAQTYHSDMSFILKAKNRFGSQIYKRRISVIYMERFTFQLVAYGVLSALGILILYCSFLVFVFFQQHRMKKLTQAEPLSLDQLRKQALQLSRIRHFRLWWKYFIKRHSNFVHVFYTLFGLALSFLLYQQIIRDRLGHPISEISIGLGACIGITYGYSNLSTFRCLVNLSFVVLVAKSFQTFVLMSVITGIILGPGMNIIHSIQETVNSFSCFLQKQVEMQVHSQIQLAVPIVKCLQSLFGSNDTSLQDLDKLNNEIKRVLKEMDKDLTGNRDYEMEIAKYVNDQADKKVYSHKRSEKMSQLYNSGKDNPTKMENKFRAKSQSRCDTIISSAVTSCVDTFKMAIKNCYNALPWFVDWIVCPQMDYSEDCKKIRDERGEATRLKCSSISTSEFEKGFGKIVEELDQGANLFNSSVSLDISYGPNPNFNMNLHNIKAQTKAIKDGVQNELSLLKQYLVIFEFLVFISFLVTMLQNMQYVKQYGENINFDNVYVTNYFVRRDERRTRLGKDNLLPFRKTEELKLITSFFMLRMTDEENQTKKTQYLMVVMVILYLMFIFITDQEFYQLSILYKKHGNIKYQVDIKFNQTTKVYGTNGISNFLRNIVKNFDMELEDTTEYSSEDCFPQIKEPAYFQYGGILLYLLFSLIFAQWTPYFLRFRRAVCAFHFPYQERARILHLYETMRRRRKCYLLLVKQKILKGLMEGRIGELRTIQWWETLRLNSTSMNAILLRLGFTYECSVCSDVEDDEFHKCSKTECCLHFCKACWQDVHQMCPNCQMTELDNVSYEDITIAIGVISN